MGFAWPQTARRFIAVAIALPLSALPASASDHPGNIFLAGDDVRVELPAAWAGGKWRAIDMDGKEFAHGVAVNGRAELGKLPVGFIDLRPQDGIGSGKVTAGVVAKSTPVEDTPIALDTGMSWFYSDPRQLRDACRLCQLAGVRWIRDRATWGELETARGVWAGETRYERAMRIEHEMGLKILQVNHVSAPWATGNPSRFPTDLRDVHNFYRGLAKRWKGQVDAIEPWNEPDIHPFGAHTGCEIASFQKAAYLGFKAGNPDLPVNQAVFAIDRAETLDEYGANEVSPYFERYDLHHYNKLADYPRVYSRHRAISGGRPMWTTEFNLTVIWADEKTKEPSDEELHFQAYRVGKVFAEALHEGTEKAFYFILGDYVERNLQYGLVHPDLTPRPAFIAFAAVGRLLNGAKPMGQVDFGGERFKKGYLFKTIVDGAERETLVAWGEGNPMKIDVPAGGRVFDHLGRELPPDTNKIELARPTVFVVLPPGGSKAFKLAPPPARAKWVEGKPCPVVLQLIGDGDVKQSAFRVDKSKDLALIAYNFSDKPAKGTLKIDGGTGPANEITIAPGAREQRTIKSNDGAANVTVRLDLGDMGQAKVAARLTTTPEK